MSHNFTIHIYILLLIFQFTMDKVININFIIRYFLTIFNRVIDKKSFKMNKLILNKLLYVFIKTV